MEMFNERVSAVLWAMGRRSPPLGGGAAALLSGLIGLSLIRMAAEITRSDNAAMADIISRVDGLADGLKQSARADVDAFNEYVAALKLPRDEPDQLSKREAALTEAGLQAAETPLTSAVLLVECLEAAADISAAIRSDVLSDLYAGAVLLNGAFLGVLATADINLKAERLSDARDDLVREREAVLGRRDAAIDRIARKAAEDGYLVQ
jgi:formiminotetrahydrofolate cyclodeaminase